MFRFEPGLKVYLHREAVDGRKAINGLALLVEPALGLNPFEPAIYVFSNRHRDRIKLLLWDHTGFWLMIKRLEADRFRWPKEAEVVTLNLSCAHDSTRLVEIGAEISEQLDFVPQQVWVIQHHRVKYAYPCCDNRIRVTPPPARNPQRLTHRSLAGLSGDRQ